MTSTISREGAEYHEYRVLDGEHKFYYDSGQLYKQEQYRDGKLHGISQSWHRDGQRKCHASYFAGKLHGEYIDWHYDTGRIWEHTVYENGGRIGYRKWRSPDGSLKWRDYILMRDRERCHIDLSLRAVMSLLHFKNRLRIRVRNKIVNKCNDRACYGLPLIPSHIVAGYCI
jgi:hypothetical protein